MTVADELSAELRSLNDWADRAQKKARHKKRERMLTLALWWLLAAGAVVLAVLAGTGGLSGLIGATPAAWIAVAAAMAGGLNIALAEQLKAAANQASEAEGRWGSLASGLHGACLQARLLDDTGVARAFLRAQVAELTGREEQAEARSPVHLIAPPTPPPTPAREAEATSEVVTGEAEPEDSFLHDAGIEQVRAALLRIGASAPPAGTPEAATSALLRWDGHLVAVVSANPVDQAAPDKDGAAVEAKREALYEWILLQSHAVPDLHWLVLVLADEPDVWQSQALASYRTLDMYLPETIPRARVVVLSRDDLEGQLREELVPRTAPA